MFVGEAVWRPEPETADERKKFTSKYPNWEPRETLTATTSGALWITFKVFLSAFILLVAGIISVTSFRTPIHWEDFGFIGLLVFFAAVFWIDYSKPSRAVGLVGIVIAIGLTLMARETAAGRIKYPTQCTFDVRDWPICHIGNGLYAIGGPYAVAAAWLILALLVFYVSCRTFTRDGFPGDEPALAPGEAGEVRTPSEEMDELKTPLRELLRHLFLRTPQGLTCLFFCVVTFIAGMLTYKFPALTTWPPLQAGSFFLVYPLFLALSVLRLSRSSFEPSKVTSIFVAVIGVMPFIYPYIRGVLV